MIWLSRPGLSAGRSVPSSSTSTTPSRRSSQMTDPGPRHALDPDAKSREQLDEILRHRDALLAPDGHSGIADDRHVLVQDLAVRDEVARVERRRSACAPALRLVHDATLPGLESARQPGLGISRAGPQVPNISSLAKNRIAPARRPFRSPAAPPSGDITITRMGHGSVSNRTVRPKPLPSGNPMSAITVSGRDSGARPRPARRRPPPRPHVPIRRRCARRGRGTRLVLDEQQPRHLRTQWVGRGC